MNLVLIPGVKLDGQQGTWTGCVYGYISSFDQRQSVYLTEKKNLKRKE